MRVVKVGISGEGRDVLGVEVGREGEGIGKGKGKGVKKKDRGKMGFVITGAQHAREVSSPFLFASSAIHHT